MSDPSFALQVALHERLSSGLSCPVHDGVPDNSPFPYVTIDSSIADEADFLASRKDQRLLYLSVWSQHRGQKEVHEIMSSIDSLLHNQPLPLATGHVVSMQVRRKQSKREPDCVTYQGAVTLSIITQH
ncbi:TPA: DUF3168 domain-containing protein [Pseudomonas putida]|jgi:Protein of unknown function (DUF3168)|uniref:DUF3168 domain-containing protein n=1 Tax=Pseudomonas putida TaxID=303 RepID=UPI00235C7707|nr:DUF3168 domain-containing protein [Pseudomonas putida]GLO19267.1 hypothetical protein PPUJ20188_26630 [Pseudomonas putida]HDS0995065.1 DUF3168 domain-containing protein [Pseudomonas putida]HDS1762868.1 DUF3168 domain-containing protein [Pseudomonas putida]